MRIEAWRIKAFGPLTDWEATNLTQDDVVIVLGPNESGKSSLFEFLTSAIFGFSPASARNHPYHPWSGTYPSGALDVVLRDGSRAHIARRLTSRAEGRVSINGNERALGNRSVPWVGLLNRGIFTNVHALTQDEALALDPKAWQAMQDRVLGGSSFDFLRPTRNVVAELQSRRARYWRPDRRGKPRDREIRARIRELKKLLSPALERRSYIEDIERRLGSIEKELRDNGAQLQRIEVELERDARLAPLLRQVNRMRALDLDASALVPSDQLLTDVDSQRKTLDAEAANLQTSLKKLEADLLNNEQSQHIDEVTGELLAQRQRIESLDRTLARVTEDEGRVERMDRRLQQAEGALRELASRIFVTEGIDEKIRSSAVGVSIVELRGRQSTWKERYQAAQTKGEDSNRAEAELRQLARDLGTATARNPVDKCDNETKTPVADFGGTCWDGLCCSWHCPPNAAKRLYGSDATRMWCRSSSYCDRRVPDDAPDGESPTSFIGH
ncbi:MAG: AAA family ATPase [Chloroflexi bacterium]|nr:AAA family ATPase [Chloroflexota bacterium]